MGLGQYPSSSRHLDENRDIYQLDFMEVPSSCLQRQGLKTRYDLFKMPTQHFGCTPYVFCVLLPWIIKLFPHYRWIANISILCFTEFAH